MYSRGPASSAKVRVSTLSFFYEEIDRVALAVTLLGSKGLNGPPILLLLGKLMGVDFLTGFRSLNDEPSRLTTSWSSLSAKIFAEVEP